ncbi:MAG: zinc-ribbon domain-containing protein [Saccharofermentanales bacterium]
MFCKNCGKEVDDAMKFCDGCGAALMIEPADNQGNTPPPTPPVDQQGPANNPPPTGDSNKVIYVLAYLGILFFLPLVVTPVTSTGKFHANQGLLLLIASVAGSIILSIITFIIPFFYFFTWIFNVAIFALAIYGMVNAYNDKQVPLPVIGNMATIIK